MTLIRKPQELSVPTKIKALIYGQAGMGKSQPIYAQVLTKNGFKKISELNIGDNIIGKNGKPQTILGIYPQGMRPVYKITTNDGSIAFCDEEHIWNVRHSTGNSRKAGFRDYTLRQMIDKGIICSQTQREKETGRKSTPRFELPVINAVEFSEKEYTVHPYILGVLIGDGSLTGSVVEFSTPDIDAEVFNNVENRIESGFRVEKHENASCPKYHIVMTEQTKGSGYINKIKELGLNVLSANKFIPHKYMTGSYMQRLELLRGLMDTDGYANSNRIYFSTSSKKLALDTKQLILSLGGIAKIHIYEREEKGIEYRVSVNTPDCPFLLKRKANEWNSRAVSRYIIDAEKVEDCECVCIKVSNEDELYVTDNYIVTHNTTLALSAPKPLLLDFDNGIHRVNYGHQADTVQINNWQEAVQVINEDLSAYETIVVDTIGKMMDYIIDDVDSKGFSGWKRWEKINDEFATFMRELSKRNKNIMLVAHRDTRKEGDETVFVPALREKNYTAIVTELDLLGYVEVKGVKRTITFNPTGRNDGKNTCNLPGLINIPTIVDKDGSALANTFIQTQVIAPYVANLRVREQAMKAYNDVISEIKDSITLITDDVSANDFISRIDTFSHVGNSKAIASKLMSDKAKELGLILNKDKRYEKPAA